MWQKDGHVTALHDFQIHKNIQRELGKPYCTSAQVTEAGAKNDASLCDTQPLSLPDAGCESAACLITVVADVPWIRTSVWDVFK